MKDVIAIGSATRDVFLETEFELTQWGSTPSGRALVIPFGEKFAARGAYFTSGGNAANAAVTFARQGLRTGIFTTIGRDAAGEELRRIWKREGIDAKNVQVSEKPTSYSILLLQNGERSIITYHGAIDEFRLRDADFRRMKSKWWYVSLPGDSYKEFSRLVRFGARNSIKIALNPSYKHFAGMGRRDLLKHLSDITFLVVNEGEAAAITGIPFSREKEVFRKLDDLVDGIVAVTSGRRGVTVSDGARLYKAGIFQNKKVLDRTGAGDAFGSGFVAGLIRSGEQFKNGMCKQENIAYAIRLASANATSVVERLGATEGILTKHQFDTMSRFRKLKIAVHTL